MKYTSLNPEYIEIFTSDQMEYQSLHQINSRKPSRLSKFSSASTLSSQDGYPIFTFSDFFSETPNLFSGAQPYFFSYLLSCTLNIASIVSLGHLGRTELVAISLATMIANITGYSVGMAMISVIDKLCSQSFSSFPDKFSSGRHLQRSIIVMFLFSLLINVIWGTSESFFRLMGQDEMTVKLASTFLKCMIPGLFPFLISDCIRRYLQAQKINRSMYILLIAFPTMVFLQWLLVRSDYNIGPTGAPIATVIVNWLVALMYILHLHSIECSSVWAGWERSEFDLQKLFHFTKLGKFMVSLGISNVLASCTRLWAWEFVIIFAGLLGKKYLAAQTVLFNISLILHTPNYAIAASASKEVTRLLVR
jgi:MATE family multidrug resistance protein